MAQVGRVDGARDPAARQPRVQFTRAEQTLALFQKALGSNGSRRMSTPPTRPVPSSTLPSAEANGPGGSLTCAAPVAAQRQSRDNTLGVPGRPRRPGRLVEVASGQLGGGGAAPVYLLRTSYVSIDAYKTIFTIIS